MLYKNDSIGSQISVTDLAGGRRVALVTAASLKAMRSTTKWDMALEALFERKGLGLPAPAGFGARRPTEASPDWSLVVDLNHNITSGLTASRANNEQVTSE